MQIVRAKTNESICPGVAPLAKLDPWGTLLNDICQHVVGQTTLAIPPLAGARAHIPISLVMNQLMRLHAQFPGEAAESYRLFRPRNPFSQSQLAGAS